MTITRENELFIATQKLPDGSTAKGSGHTVESAVAWAMWGVKGYYKRLEREESKPVRGFMRLFARA